MSFKLTLDEGRFLVRLARKAITEFLRTGRKMSPPKETPKNLYVESGVFVTLNSFKNGEKELRGCIGFVAPTLPLVEATIDSAINSATGDPRFPPVTLNELDSIVVEVSVLTPPTLIEVKDPKDYPKMIEIGKDGLIVERGFFKGLLLPQVPIEWDWNAEEFLAHCCMKAGLPPDNWLLKGTKIYKFSCVIAQELSPNGPVEVKDLRKG